MIAQTIRRTHILPSHNKLVSPQHPKPREDPASQYPRSTLRRFIRKEPSREKLPSRNYIIRSTTKPYSNNTHAPVQMATSEIKTSNKPLPSTISSQISQQSGSLIRGSANQESSTYIFSQLTAPPKLMPQLQMDRKKDSAAIIEYKKRQQLSSKQNSALPLTNVNSYLSSDKKQSNSLVNSENATALGNSNNEKRRLVPVQQTTIEEERRKQTTQLANPSSFNRIMNNIPTEENNSQKLQQERQRYLEKQRQRQQEEREKQREKEEKERKEQELKRQKQQAEKQKKEAEEKERESRNRMSIPSISSFPSQLSNSASKPEKPVKMVGLHNTGNTCYLNSVLQCLLNLPTVFNGFFLSGKYLNELKGSNKVADSYAKLLNLVRNSQTSAQTPTVLKSNVAARNNQFGGYKQQDANEFLVCLLELIAEDLKRDYNSRGPARKSMNIASPDNATRVREKSICAWDKHLEKEDSHVNTCFGGQFVASIKCRACGYSLENFDPFWDLQLSFKNDSSVDERLQSLLDKFAQPEQLEGYTCEKCKAQKSERQVQISILPKVLVLHLKRFEYDDSYARKIRNKIIYTPELRVTSYVNPHFRGCGQEDYVLVGIVNHSGSLDYGHYVADCRSPINGKWYEFDDNDVRDSELKVEEKELSGSEPYLLFYVQKSLAGI